MGMCHFYGTEDPEWEKVTHAINWIIKSTKLAMRTIGDQHDQSDLYDATAGHESVPSSSDLQRQQPNSTATQKPVTAEEEEINHDKAGRETAVESHDE
jgi:hypothetical protein